MKNFLIAGLLVLGGCNASMDSDVDKILQAKAIVRNIVNYPDTLVFHEFSTQVKRDSVVLKFSCKNGFGVSETHTMDIKVN